MPSIEDHHLYEVFKKYCTFGTRIHNPTEGSPLNGNRSNQVMMEGSKFAKLIREADLMDDEIITLTEVDITFSKIKDRNERKITFSQFIEAIKLIAEKRFTAGLDPDSNSIEEAEEEVFFIIRELEGPQISAGTTLPDQSPLVERLMEGPITYISKSPKDETKTWKEDLRSNSSPSSRRTSANFGTESKKSSTPSKLQ